MNKNSVEYLPVQVSDRLGSITTLDGSAVQFRITDVEENEIQAWTSCTNNGMTAMPLIDATQAGLTDGGTFKLYIKFSVAPEAPILGPFQFEVS